MPDRATLKLASRRCDECLFSGDRLVSNRRASRIIRSCVADDVHFVCHKGSFVGQNLHCRGFYDQYKSAAVRYAEAHPDVVSIVEIDPHSLPPLEITDA